MGDKQPGAGEFAILLRRLREDAAITQEELAARAGLTGKAIGALERGERRRPYPHTIRALGQALELDEAGLAALTRAARAPGSAPAPARTPGFPTPILGRERELGEVTAMLRSRTSRLVTLTGPGGVGKTRLAMAAAADLERDFTGGVTVVELAPVRSAELLTATIARAAGLQQGGTGDELTALAAFLGDRRLLLVLDNLEHLLPAAPDIAQLLARCPGVCVLATSRAPLRVRAEQAYGLQPLPVPGGGDLASVAASPAVQMFVERARAVAPDFTLTPEVAEPVADICRRLDGLPLALELAAAHARFLAPAQLVSRLDPVLGRSRSRDLPERQRTIGATLDWSHDLLTHDEQVVLRRLAVFAGGFSLEAAESVAGDGAGVVLALDGLVEQSLVMPAADGSARFRMLEPIRQYAAAQLEVAGETADVNARHARYFCALAGQARAGLRAHEQPAWLDRLQAEHSNLRAAVAWLLNNDDPGAAATLGAGIWLYWALRGHAGEGLGWMDRVLRHSGSFSRAQLAEAQLALAGLRYASGDIAGMREAAVAAADHARAAGTDELIAESVLLLGSAMVFQGDLRPAERLLAEAVQLSAAADPWTYAHSRAAAGQLMLQQADLASAGVVLADALRLARELGGPFTLAVVLNLQATLAQLAGDDDAARDALAEAAALAVEVGTLWTLVYSVPALATVAARRDLPQLAARLFAAGEAMAQASSLAVAFPPSLEFTQRYLPAVRDRLGDRAFGEAWAAGQAASADDVLDLIAQLEPRL